MGPMRALFILGQTFRRDETGATAIEYSLIAAGVALAIAATVLAFGDAVFDVFYSELPAVLGV